MLVLCTSIMSWKCQIYTYILLVSRWLMHLYWIYILCMNYISNFVAWPCSCMADCCIWLFFCILCICIMSSYCIEISNVLGCRSIDIASICHNDIASWSPTTIWPTKRWYEEELSILLYHSYPCTIWCQWYQSPQKLTQFLAQLIPIISKLIVVYYVVCSVIIIRCKHWYLGSIFFIFDGSRAWRRF